MNRSWLPGLLLGFGLTTGILGQERPLLRYASCGEDVPLKKSPTRAISMDINTSEIMLTLGLAPRMIAIAGVADRKDVLPALQADFDKIPHIAASYPSLDAIVGQRPDFVFAGWQYGFSESTGLTPQRLAKLGIPSYALTESCIRIRPRDRVSLEDVFVDVRTIGRIFERQTQAEALIAGWRQKLAHIPAPARKQPKVRIFLYDSGEASPYTAGRFAMPQAMMEAAGASNIFEDLASSWTGVSWEDVIARKPEFVIIVDYGDRTAAQKIELLEAKFRQAHLDAMAKKHYIVLPYAAVTPGVRTIDATLQVMQALERDFSRAGH